MESSSDMELESTPPNVTTLNSLPETSKKMYQRAYALFMDWRKDNKVQSFSENDLMAYFGELANKFKSSTLWTQYSMLKTTLIINNNKDIGKYSKLKVFLKRQSNNYRPKKSKIFTPNEINKFINEAPDETYLVAKVALIMGVMGACRRHELYHMKIAHFNDLGSGILITIPDTKTKLIRNFTITGHYYDIFKTYLNLRPQNVNDPWFFINYHRGKCTVQRIGINKLGAMGKDVAEYLKLPNPELYTGHCFRRSSATILIDAGGDITTLKRDGCWKSTTVADEEYIDESMTYELDIKEEIIDPIDYPDEPSTSGLGDSNRSFTPTVMNSQFQENINVQHSASFPKKVRGHTRAPSGSREFIEATKKEALGLLHKELDKLLDTAPDTNKPQISKEFDGFSMLFSRFLEETGPSIDWDRIEKLSPDAVRNYETLETPTGAIIHNMLNKLVVVKLNGGLGTSMGCHGPKSVIAVRNDLTFLDLTVQQIENLNKTYKVNVPLVLMNSFNTDEDTQKVVRKYKNLQVEIHTFNQSCYPRINRDSLMPISKNCDVTKDLEAWYPPGHGDFYLSFQNSGLLQKFLDQGKEWCFLSNIDNLGATVDLNILNLLLNSPDDKVQHEFVMEVTDKTKADVKGGTLIQYGNKLRLLEIAQVPKEHVDDFKSVKSFKYFNTNNLWANLGAIDRVLKQNTLKMEIIINNKTLDNGLNVIQLETAVGAAMKTFEGGIGINVPRSRFLPVKKTSDLLLVMSNLYRLQNGSLVMSPQRMFPTTPLVKLGDNHFAKVKEFLGRFSNIPDLIELDHLTVSGDVTFGRGVSLKGTVIIIANHGDRIDIPSGANLENKIVSGNMRILDH